MHLREPSGQVACNVDPQADVPIRLIVVRVFVNLDRLEMVYERTS